jgi:magnesium transporter
MIKTFIHTGGHTRVDEIPIENISEEIRHLDHVLWVDVVDPTEADFKILESEFNFHPLAIEDAQRRHQRAKYDSYDGYCFIAFYCLGDNEITGSVTATQVSIFSGPGYLVTVHDHELKLLDGLRTRLQHEDLRITSKSAGFFLYLVLDEIVNDYFPVIDRLSDRIENIEEQIFGKFSSAAQKDVFRLKRDLISIRRVIAPERDVMSVLVRRENALFDADTIFYLQDVYDHILRSADTIDTYRDLLSSELDAYLSVVSNRMNQIMKTLTASSIILMSMTLVASVYGMNFDNMPELHWHFGYAWALGLMLLIGAVVAAAFRRIDWL